ncbi:MAG: cyclase family protein [Eubacteriales bacterium]
MIKTNKVLESLSIPTKGVIYDLGSGWFNGMPVHQAHPQFQIMNYRTPHGLLHELDMEFLKPEDNVLSFAWATENISTSMHAGTHIDALCHTLTGKPSTFYGDKKVMDYYSDFGIQAEDASEIPNIVTRAVLLDVPKAYGLESLPPHFSIGPEELEFTRAKFDINIGENEIIIVRTGQMKYWPDKEKMKSCEGAGISIDGAKWLERYSPIAIGGDTETIEVSPSGIQGNPQPCHVFLIRENGIHMIEFINCEELSKDEQYTFLFVLLPLSIKGATGSIVNPIAIV